MTFRKLSLGRGWAEPSGHLSKVVCGQSTVTLALGSTFCSPVRAAPPADWAVLQVPALSGAPHVRGPSLRYCCHLDARKLCSRPWMDPMGPYDRLRVFGLPSANDSQAQCVAVMCGRGCLAGQAVSRCPWSCGSERAVRGACKDPGSAPSAFRSGVPRAGLARLFSSSLFQTSLPAGFLKPG